MTVNVKNQASSRGLYFNSGNGPALAALDIGHPRVMAIVEPDTAFWCLTPKSALGEVLSDGAGGLLKQFNRHRSFMRKEMETLRFNLTPSAVYFNPTDRCNLNCSYCYIPRDLRKTGRDMPWEKMDHSLRKLKTYFKKTIPGDRKPQIVFHGSEPLMNKQNVFRAIERYADDFDFGIQTNGTLLTADDFKFLSGHGAVIGISLDGHTAAIGNRTRKNWAGDGSFSGARRALDICRGYPRLSVICTVTGENVTRLVRMVEYLHGLRVHNCLLNPVRCTRPGARKIKPADALLAKWFIRALDRSYELYRETGHKLIVANFANILLAVTGPSSRRLMCDISPCGGGRCFFAVNARGGMFPCSEFIGLPEFKGGNLFRDDIQKVLDSEPFHTVTGRMIEDIEPCKRCAIRHFCGSPCPAEARTMNGSMRAPGAFCEFYEEQVRYAFRLLADHKESAYLGDGWDRDTGELFRF